MSSEKLRHILHIVNRVKSRLIALLLLCLSIIILLSYAFTARNSLVVNDGGATTIVGGYSGDAQAALLAAGIQPSELDSYILNPDGTPELIVNRAKTVTVCFDDGSSTTIFCAGATVADALAQLNLTVTENDLLDCAQDAALENGMVISLSRGETSLRYVRREVPFETLYVDSPDLPLGQESVLIPGETGLELHSYRQVFRNGALISDTLLSTQVLQAPVSQLVKRGTADPANCSVFSALSGTGTERSSFAYGTAPMPAGTGAIRSDSGTEIVTAAGDMLRYTRKLTVSATAYTTELDTNPNPTYSGTVARVGAIAVDSSVIPLGSRLYIVASDGTWLYGYAAAEDLGGGIRGNKVDLFFNTHAECINFGVRSAEVYILG